MRTKQNQQNHSSTEQPRQPFQGVRPPYPATIVEKPSSMTETEFQAIRCVTSGQLFGVLGYDGHPS